MKYFAQILGIVYMATQLGMDFVYAEDPTEGSYDWYVQTNENFCQKTNNPWKWAIDDPLVKIGMCQYPSLEDPKADEKYQKCIEWVNGDASALNQEIGFQSNTLPLAGEIEKSSRTYAERMDAIYDCASYNTMLRAQKDVILNKLKNIPLTPNFKAELEKKSKALERRIEERKCRNVSETSGGADFSLKRAIADQTTLEYCNYRHYLYYVDYNVKSRLGELLQTADKKQQTKTANTKGTVTGSETTDNLAKTLGNVASRAENEIVNVKESFILAFESYKEFEREYIGHVLSLAIIAKLTEIRDNLNATMNPISQLIEAGKWASSRG